jgi:excinuclease ABC subunit B
MNKFKLNSKFKPGGDQPQAIESLTKGLNDGLPNQILMGVTGSGKTYSMANVIANVNRPTLVIAHNKTLAAQLCAEFKEFFPENAVEYFVSYYDYYQPEAYIPARDAYIEKEADINEEIERLRHSATRSLFLRRDVIIVASVSCIYGLGIPETYAKSVISLEKGKEYSRTQFLTQLQEIQYERNDIELKQGRYRVKGEIIDIAPSWDERIIRLEFFGDELERIFVLEKVTLNVAESLDRIDIFPATHYIFRDNLDNAITDIKNELKERVATFKSQEKLLEANRIETRTNYDMDMLKEIGYCKGIENYSRHLGSRTPGEPGGVLIDFFPDDFITIIDESHVTCPQVRGMFGGDQSRKVSLIDYGFRLPSAVDNRPLNFDEFNSKIKQCVYVSATPGIYELELCKKDTAIQSKNKWDNFHLAEQIIRPTGLIDPEIELHKSHGQIDHLHSEIQKRIENNERVLVTTITKKLAEELCDFFLEHHIKTQYLHSDIVALERVDILYDLRKGKYDVLIGVNLLREGLDLPEVSLVAILDADKEGFLRNEKSLIQTMGRAARHVNGKVILYADKMTASMQGAIDETNRRREIQTDYNKAHNITPTSIVKEINDIRSTQRLLIPNEGEEEDYNISPAELPKLIQKLEKDMKAAAKNLEFELAVVLRDQIEELKNRSF